MLGDSRIRALQFLVSPVRSGAEEIALELARGLDPERFRNYMVCPARLLEAFGQDLRAGDVQALALTIETPLEWGAASQLIRYLRSEEIDVVHAHMVRAAAVAVPLARLAGVPVVIHTCHGREAWRKKWLSRLYWYDRRITEWSHATVAVSESTRDFLVKEKKLDPRKIVVIRNGRHLNGFVSDSNRQQKLRHEQGIGPGDPIVGVFGRFEEQKGHRYLIEALPKVLEKIPTLHVLFAGEGSLRAELETSVHSLQLDRSVHFLGYRQDWMNWMDLSDIITLPSLYEGMPLVPIEAGAMAKPVLATAVDGTCEVVVDGETGVLVPAARPEELAEALIELLQNPEKQRAFGEAGQRRVHNMFALERMLRETASLYEHLLQASQPLRARKNLALS